MLEGAVLYVTESWAYVGFLAPGATRPFVRAVKEVVVQVGAVGSD